MDTNECARIGEAARRLNNSSWVERYCGGDSDQALQVLSTKYGFADPNFLWLMCDLYERCDSPEEFRVAAELIVDIGVEGMVDALSEWETAVPAALSAGVDNKQHYVGDAYRRALDYVMVHNTEAVLVHGSIATKDGHRAAYAWVELPDDGVLFDGVLQRFYVTSSYYAVRQAQKDREYRSLEAQLRCFQHRHYGPWD